MQKTRKDNYELEQSPFYCLKSKSKLAKILYTSKNNLKSLAISKGLYLERDQVLSEEKTRHIEEPREVLKVVQKRIESLLKRIKIPEYIYALGEKRCSISNAKFHVNAFFIRTLDIEKFFLSVPKRRIYWFFNKRMKCSPDVSNILASILTFSDHLPTGSPSSPLLSYFSYMDMWESIDKVVKDGNCQMTVYIDDITISGAHIPSGLIWQVKKLLCRYGLKSNKSKERCFVNKFAFEVTGVVITSKNDLKSPNRQYRKIREEQWKLNLETDEKERKKLMQKLQGLRSQERQIKIASSFLKD
jgi:Reverse transcriptase (RNA-dependent DNA polymerase)